jgi:hypothetical protein
MAILLVVAKMRYGNDWNPFFREGLYEDEGSLGDEIRDWPEYKTALEVIRNMLRKHNNDKSTLAAERESLLHREARPQDPVGERPSV